MTADLLASAVDLASDTGYVFLATADPEGMPHITAAGLMTRCGEHEVALTEWFCPGTVENLKTNRTAALAVWDARRDVGFQLLGRLEYIEDLAVMDGYAPQLEDQKVVPQVEKRLVISIDKVLDFTVAPHCDMPLETAGA